MSAELERIENLLREPCSEFRERGAWPPEWALNSCVRRPDGALDFERFAALMSAWRLAYDLAVAEIRRRERRTERFRDDMQLLIDVRLAARLGVSVQYLQAGRAEAMALLRR